MAKVGSILRGNEWFLGHSNDYTVMELRSICANIHINAHDAILWRGLSCTRLQIGDIYDDIRVHPPQPAWLQFVWCCFSVPRWAFTTWLIIQEKLLTKDRMLLFHMQTDQLCTLCGVDFLIRICLLNVVMFVAFSQCGLLISPWCGMIFWLEMCVPTIILLMLFVR